MTPTPPRLCNMAFEQYMHICSLYKARAALWPQLWHMPAFSPNFHAGQRSHTTSSTQASVDATQPLRKAVLTNLTTPHAVATSPLCGACMWHTSYDRICAAQAWHQAVFKSHGCYTALLRLDTAVFIFLVTLYLSCFSLWSWCSVASISDNGTWGASKGWRCDSLIM